MQRPSHPLVTPRNRYLGVTSSRYDSLVKRHMVAGKGSLFRIDHPALFSMCDNESLNVRLVHQGKFEECS
jgi:hypothetical protein